MRMDRVDEILNSAEIGIYRIILRKGRASTASRFSKVARAVRRRQRLSFYRGRVLRLLVFAYCFGRCIVEEYVA